jgi:hypothetical protein
MSSQGPVEPRVSQPFRLNPPREDNLLRDVIAIWRYIQELPLLLDTVPEIDFDAETGQMVVTTPEGALKPTGKTIADSQDHTLVKAWLFE